MSSKNETGIKKYAFIDKYYKICQIVLFYIVSYKRNLKQFIWLNTIHLIKHKIGDIILPNTASCTPTKAKSLCSVYLNSDSQLSKKIICRNENTKIIKKF